MKKIVLVSILVFVVGSAYAQSPEEGSVPPPPKKVSASGARKPANRAPAKEKAAKPSKGAAEDFRLTFDLGLSVGSVNNKSYTEFNLGLNTYFTSYFAWRNAVFARFASGVDNIYGLDSSVRGIFSTDLGALGFTAFAGPGYRFASRGGNVPFAEGGLVFKLPMITLGGGIKAFFNKMVDSNSENDTQYFIILSGGGSL